MSNHQDLKVHQQLAVITFDEFGTLVKISDRRWPFKRLMQWMKDNSREPDPNDAAAIMSHSGSLEEIAAQFGVNIPEDLLIELSNDLEQELKSIILYEDTLCTLEKLKQAGFRIALCSNLAAPYGQAVLAMHPKFDAYAWSYEVGAIKPDVRIYQYIIDSLACAADEVLFIGDTPLADVEGPIAFGMSARLINRKKGQNFADILSDLI